MPGSAKSLSPCLLLAVFVGCGEASAPRERFEIVTDFDGPICAGNLRHLDERLAWLEETLDLSFDETIEFHWLEGEHTNCNGGGGGCALGRTIWAPWQSVDHELVHLVLGTLGRPKAFLSEGAAVALSQRFVRRQTNAHPSQWVDCDLRGTGEYDGPECYEIAGHFVRFLIETRGIERFKQLYERSDRLDDRAKFAADVAAVYGASLLDLEVLYLATGRDVYPGLDDCGGPAIAWDGGAYSGDFAVACDDPEVLRVSASGMQREVRFTLSTPTAGRFLVEGSEAYARFCPPAAHDDDMTPAAGLEPGTYSLYLGAEIDAPATWNVEFVPE